MNNSGEKNRITVKQITSSRIFWMVISLLAAFFLWTYVTSTEGVEIEKTLNGVKVEFLGADALRESNGLIVTEQDCTSVNLTLSGVRRVINKLNASAVSATVDLRNVTADGRYSVTYDISYPNGVSAGEVTVVKASEEVINFYVDKLLTRTVPVEGDFTGNTANDYMADENPTFDPLMVRISGPKKAVNSVDHAYININRENLDKTLEYSTTYDLIDADGQVIDNDAIVRETAEVAVTLKVLSTKSVPLDVTIIDGGGATREENTTIVIEPATVTLAGDASVIDSTNKLNIGTIDLSDFASNYSATFTIVPPNDTENLTGVNEATVTVSLVGLNTRSFTVTDENISCINVPDGFSAEIVTRSLGVTVRASEEILDQIKANNLSVVANLEDMENVTAGVYNPAVQVYINGFPEAGVVFDYRVYVSLIEGEG